MAKDGFDAAPAPVGGLGNFKGVMLCNRPSDEPASRLHGGRDGEAPFKSMVAAAHGEQLGLKPIRGFEPTVKTRGPSAALRRHVRWLKELQGQMRVEREQVEADEQQDEEKRRRTRAAVESHREAVREMMYERDQGRPARTEKKAAAKPLWAMTEREKEDFEEGEGDDLISFAENLDYEKYLGDLEFRQGVQAVRDRTGKLQREQDSFKDALVQDFNARAEEEDEGRSTSAGSPRSAQLQDGIDGAGLLGDEHSEYSGSSRRSRAGERQRPDGRPDWDASTACGEERAQAPELKTAAERVLESAPQLRAIHSKESVQRIIEKARDRQPPQPADLIGTMRREGPVAAPLIVASEDAQTRLSKPVDPSQLPYLYRSPAV